MRKKSQFHLSRNNLKASRKNLNLPEKFSISLNIGQPPEFFQSPRIAQPHRKISTSPENISSPPEKIPTTPEKILTPPEKISTPPEKIPTTPEKNLTPPEKISTSLKFSTPRKFLNPP